MNPADPDPKPGRDGGPSPSVISCQSPDCYESRLWLQFFKWLCVLLSTGLAIGLAILLSGCPAATIPLGAGGRYGALQCSVSYVPPQWSHNPDLPPSVGFVRSVRQSTLTSK